MTLKRRHPWLGLALACAALSGCATTDKGSAKPAAASAFRELPPRERVSKALELMVQGKPDEARALLLSALQEQPANDMARKLLSQIDTDPKVLLGAKAYPYRARSGETASQLAERFLGDPLMFYALARYNQIDPPSQALDGRTVMIPGEPRANAGPARPSTPAAPSAAKPATPPAAAARRDPARAAQLRSAGLIQMNKGAINQAVGLLRQALALDPENAAIKRDLDRAVRIQRTVQTR